MLDKFLKIDRVIEVTGMSKSSVYAGVAAGTFPKPVKTGAKSSVWVESEIAAWQADRVAKRDGAKAV